MKQTSKQKTGISPRRDENYSEWYQMVIKEASLAEHSPVRGCMIIKPWGYSLWENMQSILDKKLKETGHQNAYFPLFIPLSFFEKEAKHVEGFAKECAVVTHHRLQQTKEGKLIPAGELEEPLIIRPTSETIIGEMFSQWITSYRDLPLLMNQWANIVRWEMRTRLFLRTTEFLWQEGHTAHATEQEALEETKKMLHIYEEFATNTLAIPVIPGEKTPSERFPGAVSTYCIEAMMQDRKALQLGTSHFLGQNFAKASSIQFRDALGNTQYAWTTSWGVTTRMIGALIMTHSDDDGLVIPPKISSVHVVIIPVIHQEDVRSDVLRYCHQLALKLRELTYHRNALQVVVDEKEMRGGEKNWKWIKMGVPIRIEIGPRDMAKNSFLISRRDKLREKIEFTKPELIARIVDVLDDIQTQLYQKALAYRDAHLQKIDDRKDFYDFFTPKDKTNPEIHGGFALAHWCGDEKMENQIKEDLGVTIRCIPHDQHPEEGKCFMTGKKSKGRVIYAKAY